MPGQQCHLAPDHPESRATGTALRWGRGSGIGSLDFAIVRRTGEGSGRGRQPRTHIRNAAAEVELELLGGFVVEDEERTLVPRLGEQLTRLGDAVGRAGGYALGTRERGTRCRSAWIHGLPRIASALVSRAHVHAHTVW